MTFVIAKWDLPGSPEAQEQYNAKSAEWREIGTNAPGLVAVRFLRNPLDNTPQVCAVQEFDSMESARAWIESPESAALRADMRAHGCSNQTTELWDKSPLVPDPILPG